MSLSRRIMLERAAEAMKERLETKLKRIHVPLFDQGDVKGYVYFGPEKFADRQKYYAQIITNDLEGAVWVVVRRCLSEAGNRLFTDSDFADVRDGFPPELIEALSLRILRNQGDDDLTQPIDEEMDGEVDAAEPDGEPVQMGES